MIGRIGSRGVVSVFLRHCAMRRGSFCCSWKVRGYLPYEATFRTDVPSEAFSSLCRLFRIARAAPSSARTARPGALVQTLLLSKGVVQVMEGREGHLAPGRV